MRSVKTTESICILGVSRLGAIAILPTKEIVTMQMNFKNCWLKAKANVHHVQMLIQDSVYAAKNFLFSPLKAAKKKYYWIVATAFIIYNAGNLSFLNAW